MSEGAVLENRLRKNRVSGCKRQWDLAQDSNIPIGVLRFLLVVEAEVKVEVEVEVEGRLGFGSWRLGSYLAARPDNLTIQSY